jgi:hypothetical protein
MASAAHEHHPKSDSAGTPWEGRQFDHNAFAHDDGAAPADLLAALIGFRAGGVGEADVVNAIRSARLLIPLVAELGDSAAGHHGLTVDKSADLSIVTVAGPDGRSVMPVFSSVSAMQQWNPAARPVPADAVRVALAAASEDTELVVVDATTVTEFVIRRPALWAIAQSQPWLPSYLDESVLAAFLDSAATEPAVTMILLDSGDADARLTGPELVVQLTLIPGLTAALLEALLARLQSRWSADGVIAARVDSLRIHLATATD